MLTIRESDIRNVIIDDFVTVVKERGQFSDANPEWRTFFPRIECRIDEPHAEEQATRAQGQINRAPVIDTHRRGQSTQEGVLEHNVKSTVHLSRWIEKIPDQKARRDVWIERAGFRYPGRRDIEADRIQPTLDGQRDFVPAPAPGHQRLSGYWMTLEVFGQRGRGCAFVPEDLARPVMLVPIHVVQ